MSSLAKARELPRWYELRPFIHSGYRRPGSVWRAVKSLGEWHNETLNIYSHLLPGAYWLYMFYNSIGSSSYWLTTNGYLLASIMGFMSAYYHTFHIVNPWYAYVSKRMDYVGIVAVNLAHQQLDTHIIFYMIFKSPCLFYIATAVEVCFAIGCVLHISSAAWAGKFWAISYPILSSVPLTAITVANSHLSKNIEIASSYSLGCSVLVILAGTVFYAGKFPERCYELEGTFDYCSSHFWFHLLIVGSILSAFGAVPYITV